MLTIFLIYFFLLGIIIGSFLNVVILRFNTGKNVKGRSACMSCKSQLTWRELIPVFSFLFQKGRCKNCKTKISWQYPLVELLTGLLFVLNFYYLFQQSYSMVQLVVSVGFLSCILALIVIILVYDIKHKIIPDVFSFSAFILSIIFVGFLTLLGTESYLEGSNLMPVFSGVLDANNGTLNFSFFNIINMFAGVIFYIAVWLLWRLSKGRLIGLGDAKLLLTIGTLLGIVYGLSAIFISAWVGALYAIFIMLKHRLCTHTKRITMKTEIPFGPFLIIGFLIVYFLRIDVTNIGFILENFS